MTDRIPPDEFVPRRVWSFQQFMDAPMDLVRVQPTQVTAGDLLYIIAPVSDNGQLTITVGMVRRVHYRRGQHHFPIITFKTVQSTVYSLDDMQHPTLGHRTDETPYYCEQSPFSTIFKVVLANVAANQEETVSGSESGEGSAPVG